MSVRKTVRFAALAAVTACAAGPVGAIVVQTVPVGNLGNAADTRVMSDGTSGYGAVAYAYDIGAKEVTNAQYAAFLNAIAVTDPNNVYNAGGGTAITRVGIPGFYSYFVDSFLLENHPVVLVSYWDACRFANWLHNGQPCGAQDASTTEDGAYTLSPSAISANSVVRNPGARWALPSENEWYKAAYHQPTAQGGDFDGYWFYPTSTNSITTSLANYSVSGIGQTTVGGSYAANFYGVFDLAGNVWEWNESVVDGVSRVIRGGSYSSMGIFMQAGQRGGGTPLVKNLVTGFRVVRLPVSVPPCNNADADGSGTVTVNDLFTFLARWFAQNGQSCGLSADIDGSSDVSVNDLFAFLALWFGYNGTAC